MGTPVPNVANENKSGPGEYREYTLSSEELEKYRSMPGPKDEKKKTVSYNITREQYLQARANGKSRRDIAIERFGNNLDAFKGHLAAWGIVDIVEEKKELEKLNPPAAEPAVEQTMAESEKTSRKSKSPNLTKEFVLSEFEKGKSAAQIEREQGMSRNSLFYYMKRWGIRSPHGTNGNKKPNSPIHTLTDQKRKENASEKSAPAAARAIPIISLQIPIINNDHHPIEQRIKVYEATDDFSSIMESSELNRERAAAELFSLIQTFVGLIHADLKQLMPGQDVSEHVIRFFEYHNKQHNRSVKN